MIIPIAEHDHLYALLLEKRIEKTETLKAGNPTGLCEPSRYFKGYVGELCFEAALINADVEYKFKPSTDGKADTGDFVVWSGRTGEELRLDVKTGGSPDQPDFMMPESQWSKRKSQLYVGARLNLERNHVELMGWATRPEVAGYEIRELKVPTRLAPYSTLRPMKSLFAGLRKNAKPETNEQNGGVQPASAVDSPRSARGAVCKGDALPRENKANRARAESSRNESAGATLFD